MIPEIDPIEAYLDEVCKNVFFAPTNESMARGMRKLYGIDPPADTLSKLPGDFRKAIEVSSAEAAMLRAELRMHLDASVTRIELDGVPHDDAVRQAIAEFGDSKELNRRLKREHKGTVSERVKRALKEEKNSERESKARKALRSMTTFVGTYCVISAQLDYVGTPALTWGVRVFFAGFFFTGILQYVLGGRSELERSEQITAQMAELYDRPIASNASLSQRLWRWIFLSRITGRSNRRNPSPTQFAKSIAKSVVILTGLWLISSMIPVDTHWPLHRYLVFYFYLLNVGKWLGDTTMMWWEKRRGQLA